MTNHWGKFPSLSRFFFGENLGSFIGNDSKATDSLWTVCDAPWVFDKSNVAVGWWRRWYQPKTGKKGGCCDGWGFVVGCFFLLENKHGKISQGFGKKRSR